METSVVRNWKEIDMFSYVLAQWKNFCPEKYGSLRQFVLEMTRFKQLTRNAQENIF